jgi:hypothetical protein
MSTKALSTRVEINRFAPRVTSLVIDTSAGISVGSIEVGNGMKSSGWSRSSIVLSECDELEDVEDEDVEDEDVDIFLFLTPDNSCSD